jgi:uncharacterized protein (TIGR02996 family)
MGMIGGKGGRVRFVGRWGGRGTMPQDDAFLRAICEAPEDDTARLVYADWLEEHGRAERAEFIRVQCALAGATEGAIRPALQARERDLLMRYGGEWAQPLAGRVDEWTFRRGFIDEVRVEGRAFLAGAEALFRLAPVQHLHLFWNFVLPYQRTRLMGVVGECTYLARLRSLVLRSNYIGSDGVEALAVSEHLGRLDRLDLSWNHIGDRGVRRLAESPLLARLTHLDLSHNDIKGPGMRALAGRLDLLAARGEVICLRTLDLTDNQLGEAGRHAIRASPVLKRVARW